MSKWEVVRLGDVCRFINGDRGTNYPSSKDFVEEGVPFINAGHLKGKAIDFSDMNYITEERYEILGSGKIKINDILYCLRGSLGKLALVTIDKGAIASSLVILRSNSEKINCRYLIYCLESECINIQQCKANNGSSQPNLSAASVKRFEIPLPPLDTQKHIADTLDKTQEIINCHKKRIEELDNLIKAVFYNMFGDPITNEKVREVKLCNEIATKIGSGATPKGGNESYKDSGISLIRSLNVHNGFFKYDDLAFIDEEQADKLKNVIVEENDVLLNITGASVARSCIVPRSVLPARVNQHVSIIRTKPEIVNYIYLNCLLTDDSFQSKLWKISTGNGATREAITKQQIEGLEIIIPPLSLQQKFAEIVTNIEEQKAIAKRSLSESQNLFNSLMNKYFK